MTRSALTVVSLVVFLVAAPAPAQPSAAKEHFDKAMIFYNVQDWDSAIRELRAAYMVDQRPEYLFMLGQAQRLAGDCPSAIKSYRAYLRVATGTQGAAAEGLIHSCEAEAEKAKKAADQKKADELHAEEARQAEAARKAAAAAAAPATSPGPAPAVSVAAPAAPEHHHWYGDALGGVLFFPGLAGVGTGVTFLVLGNGAIAKASSTRPYSTYLTLVASGRQQQTIGVAALAAGAALMAGGVIRYLVVGARDDGPTAALVPTSDGAALVLSGRF